MSEFILKNFSGMVRALDGETPSNCAYSMLNMDVNRGRLKFRRGFLEKIGQPLNFTNCLGFKFVLCYNETTTLSELISIENRNGTIKPYSITSWGRTEITNGGTAVALEDRDHFIVPFHQKAYIIVPDAAKTLYRKTIGTINSWDTMQDTAYSASPDEDLTPTPNSLGSRGWDAGDAWTYTSSNGIQAGATFTPASGIITVAALDNDNGVHHRTQFQSTLVGAVDYSKLDQIAFRVTSLNPGGGTNHEGSSYDIFNSFERTNISPEVKIGATWHVIPASDFKEYIKPGGSEVVIAVRLKGLAGTAAIVGFRFTVGGTVNRFGSPNACTIQPIHLGGTYLGSSVSTHRLWDGTLEPAAGITYGFRYKKAGPLYSNLKQTYIDAGTSQGYFPTGYSLPLGGKISLSVPVATTGGYTDVEFVRLKQDGVTWVVIATVANSGVPQFVDIYEENELAALTPATGITDTPISPTPLFQATGLLCAVMHKKTFMIWCFKGTLGNVKMSRVLSENYPNAAEELYSSSVTYDNDGVVDESQPANYTLNGDEAIGVVSSGDVVYYFGRMGVYAQSGNSPITMTPFRQIPTANAVAGPKAFCQYSPQSGRHGVCFLDKEGTVWYVSSQPRFESDTTTEPTEISKEIRGFIKEFLVDQQSDYGYTDLSAAVLGYSEADKILRIALGNREVVLRQDHFVSKGDYWECYDYNLGESGTITVSSFTDWSSNGAAASSVDDGSTADFSVVGNAFASDDAYAESATIAFGAAKKTDILRVTGIKPQYPLSTGATLTSIKFRIEASKVGELNVFDSKLQPRLLGVDLGANLATSTNLSDSDTIIELTLTTGLPTVAASNAGNLEIDIQFTQEEWNSNWNNPANWVITVSSGGASVIMIVTATYIGPGVAPTFVYVLVFSSATAWILAGTPPYSPTPWYGVASASNGLGDTSGTPAIVSEADPSGSDSHPAATGTHRVRISLSGGTGTTTVTRSVTGTASQPGTIISGIYVGSAVFASPIPSLVRVDDVEAKYFFDLTTVNPAPPAINWVTNGLNDAYYWALSSGQVHEVNYDSTSKTWIVGEMCDGGRTPVDAYWESGDLRDGLSRLLFAVPELTTNLQPGLTVSARSDRKDLTDGFRTGSNYKFGVGQQGRSHRVRFTFGPTFDGVSAVRIETRPLSKQRTK